MSKAAFRVYASPPGPGSGKFGRRSPADQAEQKEHLRALAQKIKAASPPHRDPKEG